VNMTLSFIGSALIVIIAFGIGRVYYRKHLSKAFDKGTQSTNQIDKNLKPAIGLIIIWSAVIIAFAITAYFTLR
jgi:hypothetical protein